MADVNIHVSIETRDRLVEMAAAEGMSLSDWLSSLAGTLLPPAERAARAEQALAAMWEWSGYNPTEAEIARADAHLRRQLAEAGYHGVIPGD